MRQLLRTYQHQHVDTLEREVPEIRAFERHDLCA